MSVFINILIVRFYGCIEKYRWKFWKKNIDKIKIDQNLLKCWEKKKEKKEKKIIAYIYIYIK